jgi:large subunit ribosomal protein L21
MEYAIVEIGGHQSWIERGQQLITNRMLLDPGSRISLTRILVIHKTSNLYLGYPYLKIGNVEGQIMEHLQGEKITVYKMKSKKKYRRKQGHRQKFTRLVINNIEI